MSINGSAVRGATCTRTYTFEHGRVEPFLNDRTPVKFVFNEFSAATFSTLVCQIKWLRGIFIRWDLRKDSVVYVFSIADVDEVPRVVFK